MTNWFKKLSPTMQIVVVIILVILVVIVWRTVRSYMHQALQKVDSFAEQTALNAQGINRSYTISQYNSFAGQLHLAMNGLGTDEETIYSVFSKMNNDLDVIALNNAFGIRDSYDLSGWLRSDLNSAEVQNVNTILANKGITKSF